MNSAQVSGELGWFSTHRWYQVPDYTTNPARRAAGEAAEHWSLKVLLLLLGSLIPPPPAATPQLWGAYSAQEFGHTTIAKTKRDLKAKAAEAKRKEAEGEKRDAGELVGQGNHDRLSLLLDNLGRREANILNTVNRQSLETKRYLERKLAGISRHGGSPPKGGSRGGSPERSISMSMR